MDKKEWQEFIFELVYNQHRLNSVFFFGGGVILVSWFWVIFALLNKAGPVETQSSRQCTKDQLIKVLWFLFYLFFFPFYLQIVWTSPTPCQALTNSRRMKFLSFQNVCAPHIKHNSNFSVWGAKFCQADWGLISSIHLHLFPVLKPQVQQMQKFFGKVAACHNFTRVKGKSNF